VWGLLLRKMMKLGTVTRPFCDEWPAVTSEDYRTNAQQLKCHLSHGNTKNCALSMDECLVSVVVKWSSVISPLSQKLLFFFGITCRIPGRVLSDEVCGLSWGSSSVYTRYCNPAGSGHCYTKYAAKCPALGRPKFYVSVFSDTSVCTTYIVIRNGRTLRGPGFCLSTCSVLIERVIPYPHLFPWHYKCFVNFHDFQRYGILHTQIYEVIMALHTVERTASTLELDDRSSRS